MKRILLMVAYNILLVPYMWFKLCYYASHVDKYTEEERYKVLRFIDSRAIKGGREYTGERWVYVLSKSSGSV